MHALVEIAGKAIADYGFGQVVLYSIDDVFVQWGLSSREAGGLRVAVLEALEALPIPVEPRMSRPRRTVSPRSSGAP